MKVVYIEDDQALSMPFQAWFTQQGHRFSVAADTTSGYALAVAEQPDIILIDLMLGELDGLTLALELGNVPVLRGSLRVAATASDHDELIKPALAAGCVGYVYKPFTPSELLDKLNIYMAGHRDSISAMETIDYLRSSGAKLVGMLKAKIAERDRQYEELQKAQEQLISTERLIAVGELGLRMAHELNNPLQAVQSALNLIAEKLPYGAQKPEVTSLFDFGYAEIRRASKLANSLLDVFTTTATKHALINCVDVINDVATLIRPEATRYGIDLETPAASESYRVQATYADLHQVLRNLMQNGVEAMRNNPYTFRGQASRGKLCVEIVRQSQWLRISVIDSGSGLSDEALGKLGQLFYSTRTDGHGIGLYICNLIARANNAQIKWHNNSDRGSTFHLLWPYTDYPE